VPLVPEDCLAEKVKDEDHGGTSWCRFTWQMSIKMEMVVVLRLLNLSILVYETGAFSASCIGRLYCFIDNLFVG